MTRLASGGAGHGGRERRASLRDDSGQATVELLALVPLLAAIALAVLSLLAAQSAKEAAYQAAVAGAIAKLQGADVDDAAKAASPGWSKASVRVNAQGITVRVAPRAPRFVADLVDAERRVKLP